MNHKFLWSWITSNPRKDIGYLWHKGMKSKVNSAFTHLKIIMVEQIGGIPRIPSTKLKNNR